MTKEACDKQTCFPSNCLSVCEIRFRLSVYYKSRALHLQKAVWWAGIKPERIEAICSTCGRRVLKLRATRVLEFFVCQVVIEERDETSGVVAVAIRKIN